MSAQWDVASLVRPISTDEPCGENLEESPLLASFDTFRLFGQSAPFDAAPDWVEIRNRAADALARSKDLRLLAHLGAAALRTDGISAFTDTLTAASAWLDSYWDRTYPRVDEDPVLRRSALNCFTDPIAIVDGLRRAPLVSSRQLGGINLRHVEIAAGQLTPIDGEASPDGGQIAAAFAAAPIDDLTRLAERVEGALSAVKKIDQTMRTNSGVEASPALDPLAGQLGRVARVLKGHLATHPERTEQSVQTETGASHDGAGDTTAAPIGAIRSRQDAIKALDAVAEFFRRTEPSSPVPLFLERAKRLVSKDFLEVLADIAPDALPQARAAGGVRVE